MNKYVALIDLQYTTFCQLDSYVLELLLFLQDILSFRYLLRDIYEDLVGRLIELSTEENILLSQPCRDNTLYLLKLIDDMLISELDTKLPVQSSALSS